MLEGESGALEQSLELGSGAPQTADVDEHIQVAEVRNGGLGGVHRLGQDRFDDQQPAVVGAPPGEASLLLDAVRSAEFREGWPAQMLMRLPGPRSERPAISLATFADHH